MGDMLNNFIYVVGSKLIDKEENHDYETDLRADFQKRLFNNGSSIKEKARKLIMQFPILISNNISLDTMNKIASGLEYENANLIKLIIENDLGGLASKANNTQSVIGKLHSNINDRSIRNDILPESLNLSVKDFTEANLNLLKPLEEKINPYSLNEATYPKYIVNEARKGKYDGAKFDTDSFDLSKIKKINELQPLMIKADLRFKNNDKDIDTVKISFGVKSVLHPIDSEDIIYNVAASLKNASIMFKFVRWTSGEIKFWKDIVLQFEQNKNAGIQAAKEDSFWWYKLRKLSKDTRNKGLRGMESLNRITTLVLTKDEVDEIKRQSGFDLTQTMNVMQLFSQLFILNFMYVDEATERVFVFDENTRSYVVKKISDFKKKSNKEFDINDLASILSKR